MAQKDTLINLPILDGKIFYEHVYQDSDMTKNDLFVKSKDVFLRLFPDTKGVIQNEDKDNGIVSGKGYFSFIYKDGIFNMAFSQTVRSTFRVIVKDGKYKVEFFDFYFNDAPIEIGYYNTREKKDRKVYRFFSYFNNRVLQIFNQVETEMNKKLSTDF